MKLSNCYDATYHTFRFGKDSYRPAITAKRARQIFEAATKNMKHGKTSRVNSGLTNTQAFEILSKSVTPDMADETILNSIVSRNIVREFGRFL